MHPVVLFDIGGTLIRPAASFGEVYAGAFAEVGLDLPAAELQRAALDGWRETEIRLPSGTCRFAVAPGGEDGFWLRLSMTAAERVSGRPVDEGRARQALKRIRETFRRAEAWRIFPDVRPTLEGLRAAGTRLGVVSNWDSLLPSLLRTLELDGYFETIGVSAIEGCEKPSAELFHRVLERLGVAAEDALHVGDVPEMDLDGARAAGVAALLIDRQGHAEPQLPTIRDLRELLP